MTSKPKKITPSKIEMIIFDFDGVFTNNEVIIAQDGTEMVTCNRSDGLGISFLQKMKIPMIIISTEANPVVTTRAKKLNLNVIQNVKNKKKKLLEIVSQKKINLHNTIYVGNDVNDLECMKMVGCSIVPADAHESVKNQADIVLSHNGGKGAVRELADYIIDKFK